MQKNTKDLKSKSTQKSFNLLAQYALRSIHLQYTLFVKYHYLNFIKTTME